MEAGKLGVTTAFPTFIVSYLWPDIDQFNDALRLELYKLRARDPEGVYRSNMAGTWHSDLELLKKAGEPGRRLGQMFFQTFSALGDCHGGKKGGKYEMNLSAWAMMYSDRGYATPHTHPNCHFSGVYYIDTGDGAEPAKTMATGVRVKPGMLEFVDTRGGPGAVQISGLHMAPAFRVPPRPGLMIVFPAWLPHFVHPVQGNDIRLAVACNASVKKYTEPPKEEKNDPDKHDQAGDQRVPDPGSGSSGSGDG